MKEGLDCAGAKQLCKQQHGQLPLRYMIDVECCVGRKVEGRRGRGREGEGRGEVEGCGGRGGGGGMWREREGGGGRWRDVEGCEGRDVEGCGGREVSLTKSSYGLDRLLTHVHKQVHDSLQL